MKALRAAVQFSEGENIMNRTSLMGWMAIAATLVAAAAAASEPERIQVLTASDSEIDDAFGSSTAIDGTTLVVGADHDDMPGAGEAGTAYVFERIQGTWSQVQKLSAPDPTPSAFFGRSATIQGDTIVIGAPFSRIGSLFNAGAVYVFVRADGSWKFQSKLVAPTPKDGGGFGISVAIDGTTILVGSHYGNGLVVESGAVYSFSRSGQDWTYDGVLAALDGESGDRFGWSVAIRADRAIVGAQWDREPIGLMQSGAAYLFERSNIAWTQVQKFKPSDLQNGDAFGSAVGLTESQAIICAPSRRCLVYEPDAANWTLKQSLYSDEYDSADGFGNSVAVTSTNLLIGAFRGTVPGTSYAGETYVYNREANQWTRSAVLSPSSPEYWGGFGVSVAASNGIAAIAAVRNYNTDPRVGPGSVSIFDLQPDTTPPVIQPDVTGTLGNYGWYVSTVGVSWAVTDSESEILSTTGCSPTAILTDTASDTLTCSATSHGGTAEHSVIIKRDATSPRASASASPTENQYGWRNATVAVTFAAVDDLSGVDGCVSPVVLPDEGAAQSGAGRCYDAAGNESNLATVTGINIDKSVPTISISSPVNSAIFRRKQKVLADYNCADALSGVVSCTGTFPSGEPIDTTSKVATAIFTVTAVDKAGNSATQSVRYRVR